MFSIVYQTMIAEEIAASLTALRAGLRVVFALVSVFNGLGMYLAHRLNQGTFDVRRARRLCTLTGVSMLLSLATCLMVNEAVPSMAMMLGVSVTLIGVTLTLFGMVYSTLLLYFMQRQREGIGGVVAVGLCGLVCGFAVHGYAVMSVGNNLSLLIAGACCMLLPLGRIGAVAAGALTLVALLNPSLDQRIEQFRDIRHRFEHHSYLEYMSAADSAQLRPILDCWSPNAKINLYKREGTTDLAGCYNYYITWIFQEKADDRRHLIYSFVQPTDRTMMIAVGGGWPLRAVPEKAWDNLVGVELDPVVTRFFTQNPAYNAEMFKRVTIINMEGRAALETATGHFDNILIDLPGSPATRYENPVEFENYLLTQEAFRRAMDLLRPNGVLVAYLLEHQIGAALSTARSLGLRCGVLLLPGPRRAHGFREKADYKMALVTSPNQTQVDRVVTHILETGRASGVRVQDLLGPITQLPETWQTVDQVGAHLSPDTDDRPFSAVRKGEAPRATYVVLNGAAVALVVGLIVSLVLTRRRPDRGQRRDLAYFFLIGVGFVTFQMYAYARFRSLFGDPASTTMAVTLLIFVLSSVGSTMTRLLRRPFHPLGAAGVVALLLLLLSSSMGSLPFHSTSAIVRTGASLLVLAPFGILAGVFFPLGLIRIDEALLGPALLLDALGAFVGFSGFYLLSIVFGFTACFCVTALSYTAATFILFSRWRSA